MQRTIKIIQSFLHQLWQTLIDDDEFADSSLQFLSRTVTLLILYILLDKTIRGMTNLPMGSYSEPIIYIGFLKHVFSSKYLFFFVIAILFLFYFRNRIISPWTAFNDGKWIRFIVVLAGGILAWVFSTYDFNLYFHQAHIVDRILLILLAVGIYWRPIFVVPFLTVLLSIIGQFEALAGFSWAAPNLPIQVLILFAAFHIFYLMTKRFPVSNFVIFIGSLFATHYWLSGLGKFNLNWMLYDQIYFLTPATYANGWLAFLDLETISSIAQKMAYFNVPLKIFTLIIEVGGFLFFLHRKFPRFFLISWAVLHLGIFAASGICFWMWALLDLGLLILFYRKNGFVEYMPFNKTPILVSIVLIIGGIYWCHPVKLAWQDVPMSYTYRFEGKMENGKAIQLPPAFFSPYDYQFTLSGFGYLSDQKLLPVFWGASNAATDRLLRGVNEPQQLFIIEKFNGTVQYNEKSANQFDLFIKQYVSNWNKRISKKTGFSILKTPRLLWTFPPEATFEIPEKIITVSVNQITSLYVNGQYSEIRNVPVREIEIP